MVFRAHISLLLLLIYSVFSKDASFNLGQLARDDSLGIFIKIANKVVIFY